MRIHTDKIHESDIRSAAAYAGAQVVEITQHGSQSRQQAYNFYLSGHSPFSCRSGRTGFGRTYGDNVKAASWDEWGVVFDQLYSLDPKMHCGKRGYQSREHFDWVTSNRFRYLLVHDYHNRHKWGLGNPNGIYSVAYCDGCEASYRWFIGGMTWDKFKAEMYA